VLLRHLILQHYRNYGALDVTFDPGLVVLQGANAQGKTNLLEAIYLLATTKSGRARTDAELIAWHERDPLSEERFARVIGRVERAGGETTLEILIREGVGEGGARKRFKLNGAERRAGDVLGKVNAVFFAPADVDLVDGSPSVRRRYLDVMLCQVDPGYFRALSQYNRAILQRNALLRQVRERAQPPRALAPWDELLCEQGALIVATRAATVGELAEFAAERHAVLSAAREREERFTAEVAHELRTPLATIASVAQAAQGGRDQDAALAKIARAAIEASTLVGDLLLLMRESPEGTRLHEPLDLNTVAGFAAADARTLRPGLEVMQSMTMNGAYVIGDAGALRRLAVNLIANALEHARSTIAIEVARDGENITFAVSDDGPGVAEADRDRIFDRFVKANPATSGAGLGLAICRKIAAAHGGTLVLEDRARFVVRFPAAPT